jgi:hypothetical protein
VGGTRAATQGRAVTSQVRIPRRGNPCRAEARTATARFIPVDPRFQYHTCELVNQHWGVHLCWCGCAFNDTGDLFSQRPLQRHLGEVSVSDEA